jgi:hypothetical protein
VGTPSRRNSSRTSGTTAVRAAVESICAVTRLAESPGPLDDDLFLLRAAQFRAAELYCGVHA